MEGVNAGIRDLKQEKFIVVSAESDPCHVQLLNRLAKNAGFVPQIACYVPNEISFKVNLEMGNGIVLADSFCELDDKEIKKYELKEQNDIIAMWKPDIIHMQDDWGTNDNMFFSPEIWREYIKPLEKRYAEHIHELGMIYVHHSCGYIQQIIPDLVEIGVDAINPMNVTNDVDYVMENFGHKITVVGGLDNQFMETPGRTEEEIRVEVRARMDRYIPKGRYMPMIIPNSERVFGIYMDEANKYGRQFRVNEA